MAGGVRGRRDDCTAADGTHPTGMHSCEKVGLFQEALIRSANKVLVQLEKLFLE